MKRNITLIIVIISLIFINISNGQVTVHKGEMWNIIGPDLGAWDLKNNKAKSIYDSIAEKDIINNIFMGGKYYFKQTWKSGNSTMFISVTPNFYNTALNFSDIDSLYKKDKKYSSVCDFSKNKTFIANLRGEDEYVLIKITNVVLTTNNNLDKIEFEYKKGFVDNPELNENITTTNETDYIIQEDTTIQEIEDTTIQEIKDTTENIDIVKADMPSLSLSTVDFDDEEDNQDVYSLLQASRDVFVNTAGYTFGAARFRIRGYDSKNTDVYFNGIPMNDVESGRVFWGTWGGLNDATRNKQYVNGLDISDFGFGGIGGSAYINGRASEQRVGTKANYAVSNRSYRNRFMITHSTGLMDNGFAFTFSGSRRWAQEGYKEATFYDAWAYFTSIEKKFSSKHSIALTAFGSPSERGKAGGSTQEAYDLLDNNYYNPYWGYQGEEKRNSRVTRSHKPNIILSHYFTPSKKTKITSSFAYSFGKYGSTALDWYKTRDPRPDYYRYLPSYASDLTLVPATSEAFVENSQLDWDYFYKINSENVTPEGKRSNYIVEERRTDYSEANANIILNHNLSETVIINGGVNVSLYKGRHYKIIDDLLGGDYYVDIDKFAERDNPTDLNFIQNDLNDPDRKVSVGDAFGYDYDLNRQKYGAWGQVSAKLSKFDLFATLNASQTTFWRTGYMQNGKFPDDSEGDSDKQNFFNYGAKGGLTYKITGRHYIYAEGAYMTRAPYLRNAYVSPRTRDFLVDDLKSETIYSVEGGYHLRAPKIKARFTAYYTKFEDQTRIRSFYNDLYHSFTNHILTGIDKQNVGIEFGTEIKIFPTISTNLVAAMGENIYTNRPIAVIIQDNDASLIADPKTVYQTNFYQANGPQNAFSAGLNYRNPKYWFVNVNANYFYGSFLDFNPERRTVSALANDDGTNALDSESQLWDDILFQEELEAAFTLDLFGGKSWRIDNKYYIYINIGINNILNNRDFITGGYEQLRYDYENRNVDKFPPKYFYAYGTNYFAMLGVRF